MKNNSKNCSRERILNSLLSSFSSTYLTLISIIQSASLGYLAFVVDDFLSKNGLKSFGIVRWFLVITTFLLLIAAWNEYRMGATVFVWIPKLRDALIPFSLGTSEVLVIRFIFLDLQWWFWAMALTWLVGAVAFCNMYHNANKEEDENKDILNLVKFYRWFNPVYCLGYAVFSFIFGLCVFIWPFTNLKIILAALSLCIGLVFLYRTVPYWNKIIRFARGNRADE